MARFLRAAWLRSTASKRAPLAFAAAATLFAWLPCAYAQEGESGPPLDVLKVCADPNNLPQSNRNGEGYENKIAELLARDLGRRLEYTYFPQRIGFVRNTLRARDEATQQWKCDLIIGVPKGYELTATTQPYMRSTYAIVFPANSPLKDIRTPDDLLKLPPQTLQSLRIGTFARTPAADWLLRNKLVDRAVFYPQQSGDPNVNPASVVEGDLLAKKIDLAIMWGPMAGYLASRHSGEGWHVVAFAPDPSIKFDYEISMGLRQGEKEWKNTLDAWIAKRHADIDAILANYHIPRLEPTGRQSSQ